MKKIPEGYKESELGVIPQEWEVRNIGELGAVTKLAGFEFTKNIEYDDNGEIIALRALNVKNGKLNLNEIKRISKESSEGLTRSKLNKGDLLFTYVGTIGEVAIIPENDKFHLAPNVAKITTHGQISSLYLMQYLLSDISKQLINKRLTTTSQPALSMGNLREVEVIVPPLPEQQKIAEILSSVDEHIEKLDETISEYELLKKGTMKKLLTEGIGHTEFKDSEIGRIPKEWEVRKFFDTIDKFMDYRGRTPKKLGMDWGNGDILALSALNVKMGYIDFSLEPKFSSVELYTKWMTKGDLEKNDILMTMEAPLGNIALVPDDRKYILSQRVVALKTKPFIENTYLAYYLMGERFQSSLWSSATGSTAKGISQKNLEKLSVAIPTKDEQEQIASILSSIDERIDLYKAEKADFVQVKKGLMEKLLTGKIRVNSLEV